MEKKINKKETSSKINFLSKKLIEIYKNKKPPIKDEYMALLDKAIKTLNNENKFIRPYAEDGLPGGFLELKKNIPTIIVPDIHARLDFIINILFYCGEGDKTILEKLLDNELQIVCVGDGFHAEARAADRWVNAFEEFKDDYQKHSNMDDEMRESFGVMQMIMELKISAPDNFHFLKGNHENILNENGDGNYPFRKFSYEGPMVLRYTEKFYGIDFLYKYSVFEKFLPLFVVGKNFIISHSEPLKFYSKNQIIEYKRNPDLIIGLTWTDNNQAGEGAVSEMLKKHFNVRNTDNLYYFGGHRPVVNLYNKRAKGKYIQIHNPSKFIIAYIKNDKEINIDQDIIEIKNNTNQILKMF